MRNDNLLKMLNDKIVQWTEMQNKLLNSYMKGEISKNEYKRRYNNLDEDINGFKLEINELIK